MYLYFMEIYSLENIENTVRRLMAKESVSGLLPNAFREILAEIKDLKKQRKTLLKNKRNLRCTVNRLRALDQEQIHLQKLQELDVKTKEVESLIEAIDEDILKGKDSLNDEIRNYSKNILTSFRKGTATLDLKPFMLYEKLTFKTDTLESKIAESLIKDELALYYRKIPADRNKIVAQLKGMLDNGVPKYIIRADIKSFFESVPFKDIVRKLEAEAYVSPISIRYLKWVNAFIEQEYNVAGVPRGLAFSSYLTEIFLQKIDDEISSDEDVYYYQRYVDDIIIIKSAKLGLYYTVHNKSLNESWLKLKDIFNKYSFALHEEFPKKSLIYSEFTTIKEFDYLGYKFRMDNGNLQVLLSTERKKRYAETIHKIVQNYNNTARDNESMSCIVDGKRRKREQPLRRLFGQLSAFTGNGKLNGYKSGILTGIYYSNIHLTSLKDLQDLDRKLHREIEENLLIPSNLFRYNIESRTKATAEDIRLILKKWSFVEGFKTRRFCKHAFCKRMNQIKGIHI